MKWILNLIPFVKNGMTNKLHIKVYISRWRFYSEIINEKLAYVTFWKWYFEMWFQYDEMLNVRLLTAVFKLCIVWILAKHFWHLRQNVKENHFCNNFAITLSFVNVVWQFWRFLEHESWDCRVKASKLWILQSKSKNGSISKPSYSFGQQCQRVSSFITNSKNVCLLKCRQLLPLDWLCPAFKINYNSSLLFSDIVNNFQY